jgi:thymidylate synthase
MNRLDEQYQSLLQDIIDFGADKQDRTGTGTKSIFGYMIHHNMRNGFPLLTTKKVAFKTMATELMWFLRGDTNIKYLIDNNCHIWDGDAYKNYLSKVQNYADSLSVPDDISEFQGVMDSLNKQIKSSVLTQEEFINKIKTDDEFAKTWGELGPLYGKQWRSWTKKKMYLSTDGSYENIYDEADQTVIDQIANLISNLKTNPDSRRMMVNAWNVGELDQMVLPPCHYGFQVYTRELSEDERNEIRDMQYFRNNLNKALKGSDTKIDWENIPTRAISLMWNQRSVDTFLGLPFDIASYGLLLEIIAKVVNMVPEHLVGHLGDTHLYNNHIEQAKEQISREPFELPTLNINTEFWQTESGECGVGSLSTSGFISGLADDNFCKCLLEDIQLTNYQSHPAIKAPLSS